MLGFFIVQVLALSAYYRRFAVADWNERRMELQGRRPTPRTKHIALFLLTASQLFVIGATTVGLFKALLSELPDRTGAIEVGLIDAAAVLIFLLVFAPRRSAREFPPP